MKPNRPRGPWINRFVIRVLTVILAALVYWLLGFFVQDIRTIDGPSFHEIEKKHVDSALYDKLRSLDRQIRSVERKIEAEREKQEMAEESSRSLQQTIDKLIDLQKISLEKDGTESSEKLSTNLSDFLATQKTFQELNAAISDLLAEKRTHEDEKRGVQGSIDEQQKPAREEYNRLNQRHRLKLAALQLAILIPILLVGAFLMIKKRPSVYFPLFLACGGAALIRVTLVIHEYFPKKYFKYILITVLLVAVGKMLIHFIKVVAFPKAQWLVKQYREAYERFLCPVCEYPIRTGPRRFLYWTRRTVNKVIPQGASPAEEAPYSCPSCGTVLFEKCAECGGVRHALLPHCRHCGQEKATEGQEG
jgi:hypothetical protein